MCFVIDPSLVSSILFSYEVASRTLRVTSESDKHPKMPALEKKNVSNEESTKLMDLFFMDISKIHI